MGIWNLLSRIPRSKRFGKTEPKLTARLNRTGPEQSDFASLNEVTSMRCYLNGLSKRSDHAPVSGPLLTMSVLPKF